MEHMHAKEFMDSKDFFFLHLRKRMQRIRTDETLDMFETFIKKENAENFEDSDCIALT